jgi:predicted deacylase
MNGAPIENYDALDVGAQIGDRGAKGVITVLTERGIVAISMKRPVMEQLRHSIERVLNETPLPSTDAHREIS